MSSSLGFSVCQNVPNAVRITVSCCCRSRGDYFQSHTPGNIFLALLVLIGYDDGNDDDKMIMVGGQFDTRTI